MRPQQQLPPPRAAPRRRRRRRRCRRNKTVEARRRRRGRGGGWSRCSGSSSSSSSSKWDSIPALFTSDDDFTSAAYWDARFKHESSFEWFRGYASLAPVLAAHLPRDGPLLQLGVGVSDLQLDMVLRGWRGPIVSVDYSAVAVERLRARHAPQVAAGALRYERCDARDLRPLSLADGSVRGVFEKGLLDALLCGAAAEAAAAAVVGEAWRVMAPGAAYVCVALPQPVRARLPFLRLPPEPREGGGGGGDDGGGGGGGRRREWSKVLVYEVGQQGALTGPFVCATADGGGVSAAAAALPQMAYSHLAYVCVK